MALRRILPALAALAVAVAAESHAQSLYSRLGVEMDATVVEIKRAYRRLAVKTHPDRAEGDRAEASRRFAALAEAYEILRDESLRENYDLYGEVDPFGTASGGGSGGFVGYDYDDVWELTASNFDSYAMASKELWLVKFYDSWRLRASAANVAVWNKLARLVKGVARVAVVDCSMQWQICRRYDIHRTPTVLLFPRKDKRRRQPTRFGGDFVLSALSAFLLKRLPRAAVPDLPVQAAPPQLDERQDRPWMLFLTPPDCQRCEKRLAEFRKAAVLLRRIAYLAVFTCDDTQPAVAAACAHALRSAPRDRAGELRLPAVLSIAAGTPAAQWTAAASVYSGLPLGHALSTWLTLQLADHTLTLDAAGFAAAVQASQQSPLLVVLRAADSTHGRMIEVEWRKAALLLPSVLVASVDCGYFSHFCARQGYRSYPMIRLYTSPHQAAHRYAGDWFAQEIARFVLARL